MWCCQCQTMKVYGSYFELQNLRPRLRIVGKGLFLQWVHWNKVGEKDRPHTYSQFGKHNSRVYGNCCTIRLAEPVQGLNE